VVILICAASDGENLKLAQAIQGRAQAMGLETHLIDLAGESLPLYSRRAEKAGMPPKLASLKSTFLEAQGMFFCAPEYNGSIPPVLTNIIAWLSVSGKDFREVFNAKPIGIATHSGSMGQKVLTAMRMQFSHLGANVVGREILSNSRKPFNPDSVDSILKQIAALSRS